MPTVNKDAIKTAIIGVGEAVSLKHYSGDQTYDSDQNPTRTNASTSEKAQITEPNKFEIDNSLGKISADDKKFVFEGDVTVDVGDDITLTSTSESFSVKQLDVQRVGGIITKIIAFASLIE